MLPCFQSKFSIKLASFMGILLEWTFKGSSSPFLPPLTSLSLLLLCIGQKTFVDLKQYLLLTFKSGWAGNQDTVGKCKEGNSILKSFSEEVTFQMKHWFFLPTLDGAAFSSGKENGCRLEHFAHLSRWHAPFSGRQALLPKMCLCDRHWEVTQKLLKHEDPKAAMTGDCRSHPQKQERP